MTFFLTYDYLNYDPFFFLDEWVDADRKVGEESGERAVMGERIWNSQRGRSVFGGNVSVYFSIFTSVATLFLGRSINMSHVFRCDHASL